MALYNLNNEIDRTKYQSYSETLLNEREIVELKKKQRRSNSQNSYLHLILGFFSYEYGCSVEFAKIEYFKKGVNKELFAVQKKSKKTNREFTDYRSTSDLDSAEMTQAIERFRNWSGENGIYLPAPNEDNFLNEIQVLINRNEF